MARQLTCYTIVFLHGVEKSRRRRRPSVIPVSPLALSSSMLVSILSLCAQILPTLAMWCRLSCACVSRSPHARRVKSAASAPDGFYGASCSTTLARATAIIWSSRVENRTRLLRIRIVMIMPTHVRAYTARSEHVFKRPVSIFVRQTRRSRSRAGVISFYGSYIIMYMVFDNRAKRVRISRDIIVVVVVVVFVVFGLRVAR